MTVTERRFSYQITIGDMKGIHRNVKVTDDLAQAEKYASRMLGKEWGDDREITIARIYKWDDGAYKFHSEMEF